MSDDRQKWFAFSKRSQAHWRKKGRNRCTDGSRMGLVLYPFFAVLLFGGYTKGLRSMTVINPKIKMIVRNVSRRVKMSWALWKERKLKGHLPLPYPWVCLAKLFTTASTASFRTCFARASGAEGTAGACDFPFGTRSFCGTLTFVIWITLFGLFTWLEGFWFLFLLSRLLLLIVVVVEALIWLLLMWMLLAIAVLPLVPLMWLDCLIAVAVFAVTADFTRSLWTWFILVAVALGGDSFAA